MAPPFQILIYFRIVCGRSCVIQQMAANASKIYINLGSQERPAVLNQCQFKMLYETSLPRLLTFSA